MRSRREVGRQGFNVFDPVGRWLLRLLVDMENLPDLRDLELLHRFGPAGRGTAAAHGNNRGQHRGRQARAIAFDTCIGFLRKERGGTEAPPPMETTRKCAWIDQAAAQ